MENEFMTGTANIQSVISSMTLAIFADMGWYQVDFNVAQHFPWGYKQGCLFVREKCSAWSSFPRFFCAYVLNVYY